MKRNRSSNAIFRGEKRTSKARRKAEKPVWFLRDFVNRRNKMLKSNRVDARRWCWFFLCILYNTFKRSICALSDLEHPVSGTAKLKKCMRVKTKEKQFLNLFIYAGVSVRNK